MRIAILSPVWFPVPPTRYGGIEWIVSLLAEGSSSAGHDVTLFASGDSSTKAELVSVFDEAPSEIIGTTQFELRHALSCFERAGDFDVINDHTGPLGAMLGGVVETPVVHTVHGPLGGEPGLLYTSLAQGLPRGRPDLTVHEPAQAAPGPELGRELPERARARRSIPCTRTSGDYLLFLGRMSCGEGLPPRDRGREGGRHPARIAGKMQDRAEKEYFEEHVRPNLGWGIEYLGEVDHARRSTCSRTLA